MYSGQIKTVVNGVGGIYVCLVNFVGVCARHIADYVRRTDSTVFLNIWQDKIPTNDDDEPEFKMPRLNCKKVKAKTAICVYPQLSMRITSESSMGEHLASIAKAVMQHVSGDVQTRAEEACNWEGVPLLDSDYVHELKQDKHVRKVEPENGWICEEPGCDFRVNLWLNLTDGKILCGRGQLMLDGNGHALKHARESGRRLVVRLATIHNGVGENYLYDFLDETKEGFVSNPYLRHHLNTFGLDIDKFTKTEDNFLEMEKSFQFKHDWDVIQEQGLDLEPKFGPGFTGLHNLGSSCYMNSVLQSLLSIPDFINTYDFRASQIFDSINCLHFYNDFSWQMARLFNSMNATDDFSKPKSQLNGILPKRFKEVAGRGHPEFSTSKQQDVEHYIRHLMELIDKNAPRGENPVNALRFELISRFEDIASGRVRYNQHDDVILPLIIPLDVTPTTDEEKPIDSSTPRDSVTLAQCLSRTFADDIIEDYTSPVTKEKRGAKQHIRLGSFPDYLFVQLKRFTYDMSGEQKKLHVDVTEVDELNLETFKTTGLQPGEVELEESAAAAESSKPSAGEASNDDNLHQLLNMGFTENAIRRALKATKGNDLEAATNWIISNLDDPTINDPLVDVPTVSSEEQDVIVGEMMQDFGFTRHQAEYALRATGGQKSDAINWLFENADQVPPEAEPMDAASTAADAEEQSAGPKRRDGSGVYKLIGFISHIGKSPNSGHYVVHLRKEGVWYIFNDEKICVSKRPPKTCGYVYLYKRVDATDK